MFSFISPRGGRNPKATNAEFLTRFDGLSFTKVEKVVSLSEVYPASWDGVGSPLMLQEACRIRKSCENVFYRVLSHKFLTRQHRGTRERTASNKLLLGSSYVSSTKLARYKGSKGKHEFPPALQQVTSVGRQTSKLQL